MGAPAAHPSYKVMTTAAIAALKDKKGSSRQGIIKYVVANYKVGDDSKKVARLVKVALQRGLADGSLKNSKGKGVTGSIKLAAEKPKPKSPKKKPAKKATKKAADDKPKKPKSPKKKAAPAKPKKAKSPAKKAPAKKPKAAKKAAGEKKPKVAAKKSPAKKTKKAAAKK